MKPLVIYHGTNCIDGFTSAWLAHRCLGECDFHPGVYGEPPPNCENRDVYILDFSYPREVMMQIANECNNLVVLDHHKTAQKDLENFPQHSSVKIIFDMAKCGARLTLEYFFAMRELYETFVNIVEDHDLWLKKYPDGDALNAYIRSFPLTFDWWDSINEHLVNSYDEVVRQGYAVLRYMERSVEAHIENAKITGGLNDGKTLPHPIVNCTDRNIVSLLGNELCKRYPNCPYAEYYADMKDHRLHGLRSVGDFDVSEVAKKMGGGGHKNAAGYRS